MSGPLDNRSSHTGLFQPAMYRRQLFAYTFLVVFLLLLVQLVIILKPFFSPILWAIILATASYPAYQRLLQAVGGRSSLAAGLMTGTVLIAAVLPAVYGMVLAGQQGVEAYAEAAAWVKAGHLQDVRATIGRIPGIGWISEELVEKLIGSNADTIQTSVLEGGRVVSMFLLSQGVDLATNAFMFLTDFLIMLFTLFFVFRDGEYAYGNLFRAIPLDSEHKSKIFDRLNSTLKAVVRGTFLTALAQGIVAGVTYYLLGLPFATFWGVASGILSFLPLGGTALVWVPLALYLLISGAILKAVILTLVGVLLVGLMDNVLQPILVGTVARLPVLPLFFASFGGLGYFGFLGLFLGPIVLAVVLETLVIYQEDYQDPGTTLIVSADATRPSASDSGLLMPDGRIETD